ncbi:MAG: PEP-CTERM sorting domain-containing protein [Phycisphaerae bacterium]
MKKHYYLLALATIGLMSGSLWAGSVLDPGAPLVAGVTNPANVTFLDDTLELQGNPELINTPFPIIDVGAQVQPGYVIFLETPEAALMQQLWDTSHTINKALWSDVLYFHTDPVLQKGYGQLMSYDDYNQFPTPNTNDTVKFIEEAIVGQDFSPNSFTNYSAGLVMPPGNGINTYFIESTVPEPASLGLLGLAALALLWRRK